MPEKETVRKARKDKREGKAASTQAGEFVHEEIEHIRHGKHGARSTKQAIAIGLSKARRAGVKLPAPPKGRASAETRKQAQHDLAEAKSPHKTVREALPRDACRPEARRQVRRVEEGALETGEDGFEEAQRGLASQRGGQSGEDACQDHAEEELDAVGESRRVRPSISPNRV